MSVSATKYTREVLEPVVRESRSVAEVIRKFGLKQTGGSQSNLLRRIRVYHIDTSHFFGQGANRGSEHRGGPDKLHWSAVLVLHRYDRRERAPLLRRAMIESGIPYACAICGNVEWQGRPLVLEIDHKNGDGEDNRPNNVRFLCPNCHSQTENYGSKNAAVVELADTPS